MNVPPKTTIEINGTIYRAGDELPEGYKIESEIDGAENLKPKQKGGKNAVSK
jgi:hypothetical protein